MGEKGPGPANGKSRLEVGIGVIGDPHIQAHGFRVGRMEVRLDRSWDKFEKSLDQWAQGAWLLPCRLQGVTEKLRCVGTRTQLK